MPEGVLRWQLGGVCWKEARPVEEAAIRLIVALTVLAEVFGTAAIILAAWLIRQILKWCSQ